MADTTKEKKAPAKKATAAKASAPKAAAKAPTPKAEKSKADAPVAAPKAAAPKAKAPAKKVPSGKTVTVTQIGSPAGRQAYQRATLIGLGLNKMHRTRTLEDTPSVRGMINKVQHLVKIIDAA